MTRLTRRARSRAVLLCAPGGLIAVLACLSAAPPAAASAATITPVGCDLRALPSSDESASAEGEARAPLAVHLAWSVDDDIDLQVTGPRLETVYFANAQAKAGGRLLRDARCGDPLPRHEVVVFTAPRDGRYRISLDHAAHCAADGRPLPAPPPPPGPAARPPEGEGVAFTIEVEAEGARRRLDGRLPVGHFVPVVCEFDYVRNPGVAPTASGRRGAPPDAGTGAKAMMKEDEPQDVH